MYGPSQEKDPGDRVCAYTLYTTSKSSSSSAGTVIQVDGDDDEHREQRDDESDRRFDSFFFSFLNWIHITYFTDLKSPTADSPSKAILCNLYAALSLIFLHKGTTRRLS
jgi:hypothetical protein